MQQIFSLLIDWYEDRTIERTEKAQDLAPAIRSNAQRPNPSPVKKNAEAIDDRQRVER